MSGDAMRFSRVFDRAIVAGSSVRAHMRFVLYDGGMTEQDAESLIGRAGDWVDQVYLAA